MLDGNAGTGPAGVTYRFRPGRGIYAWLLAIGVGLPLLVLVLVVRQSALPAPAEVYLLVLVPAALMLVMAALVRRNAITFEVDRLVVSTSFYRFTTRFAAIDPDSIGRVNLLSDRQWRPRFKTNGVGIPGYRSGWFRLADRSKAFMALAGAAGIGFRTREGTAVLLSPVEIDEFEIRLRERVAAQLAATRA